MLIMAGSQPGHTFPAPAGSRRPPEDTMGVAIEFRRTLAEAGGHSRTCHRHGSGP